MDSDVNRLAPEAVSDTMDLLSRAWCSSAMQVFQPTLQDISMSFNKKPEMTLEHDKTAPLSKGDSSLKADDTHVPQWKFDDLKSWIWLQKAIHPELDYDLCIRRKKWFSQKITPWNGISIRKWIKELKQKRKEDEWLQRAEVHAAISVAGVAAALAAIAAENAKPNRPNALKDTAVASAAALVAAQCAQVAEAVGAKHKQVTSAINAAMTATDASNIITLTAAAATSLRGASTLRGRPDQRERIKGSIPMLLCDEFDFNFERCRASVAKGDEIFVATPDGRCRLRSVSAVLNRDAKVILKIKKIKFLMAFSGAKESIVYDLHIRPLEEPINEAESYSIDMITSRGKIKLKITDYVTYKKWMMTINHMLILSTTFNGPELLFCRN